MQDPLDAVELSVPRRTQALIELARETRASSLTGGSREYLYGSIICLLYWCVSLYFHPDGNHSVALLIFSLLIGMFAVKSADEKKEVKRWKLLLELLRTDQDGNTK